MVARNLTSKPRGRVRTELTESAELEVRIHSPPAVSQANFQLGWGLICAPFHGDDIDGEVVTFAQFELPLHQVISIWQPIDKHLL